MLLHRYSTIVKVKQAATVGLVLIVFSFVAWQQLWYPRVWDELHLGMTRQDVYNRVGSPNQDWGEIKGAFWNNESLTCRQELWLYFEDEKVVMLSIRRYIGSRETYKVQIVRFEDSLHSG